MRKENEDLLDDVRPMTGATTKYKKGVDPFKIVAEMDKDVQV